VAFLGLPLRSTVEQVSLDIVAAGILEVFPTQAIEGAEYLRAASVS